jgi:hypothetical protein
MCCHDILQSANIYLKLFQIIEKFDEILNHIMNIN